MSSNPDGSWRWEDAWRLDDEGDANRWLRVALENLKRSEGTPLRERAIQHALATSRELEARGYWWQARALRGHATRAYARLRAAEGRAIAARGGGLVLGWDP
ncbi:MAG TPA: hypothetical protein VNZ52_16950 [Candidatus Thermoplasmatota archaeon]|nr:hypothetical protein [Candidatus Thermoplasmatota archaeon]